MTPPPPTIIQAVLITFACLQGGICITNFVKSYQILIFKIDRVMAFINSIIPLLPIINYTTMLISYNNQNPSLVPFFIEWSVAVPLLITNACKLLNLNIIQHIFPCVMGIIMTLTGYASATAENNTSMFILFAVSGSCYMIIILFMFITYCKKAKQRIQETNFPSQLTQNNLNVFKTLFYIIATTWNGYPVTFILWKTNVISIEHAIILFTCFDFISKGLCILTMLAYKLMLYNQNGYLVKAFRKVIKVQPIETLPDSTEQYTVKISQQLTLTDVNTSVAVL